MIFVSKLKKYSFLKVLASFLTIFVILAIPAKIASAQIIRDSQFRLNTVPAFQKGYFTFVVCRDGGPSNAQNGEICRFAFVEKNGAPLQFKLSEAKDSFGQRCYSAMKQSARDVLGAAGVICWTGTLFSGAMLAGFRNHVNPHMNLNYVGFAAMAAAMATVGPLLYVERKISDSSSVHYKTNAILKSVFAEHSTQLPPLVVENVFDIIRIIGERRGWTVARGATSPDDFLL